MNRLFQKKNREIGEQSEVASVTEESVKQTEAVCRNLKKKLMVNAVCIGLVVTLLFTLTNAKYVTPKITGAANNSPALFNTVLLGELLEADQLKLSKVTGVSAADDSSTVTIGSKITTSLTLSDKNEFAASDTIHESLSNVKPGVSFNVPFVVTNGTTVSGDSSNPKKIANISETSVKYKLSIITTTNLPLEYTLTDLDSNTTLALDAMTTESTDVGGRVNVMTVTNNSLFRDGKRELRYIDSRTISAHRYNLHVAWKGDEEYRDVKYMKELENIMVLLEIESFSANLESEGNVDTNSSGIVTLSNQRTDVFEQLYPTIGIEALYGNKTVRYANLGTAMAQAPDTVEVPTGGKVYPYHFSIYNASSYRAEWVANPEYNANDAVSKNNIKGHYQMKPDGTLGTYENCKVALGVPCKPETSLLQSGITSTDYTSPKNFDYYLKYNGTIYKGTPVSGNEPGTKKKSVVPTWRKIFNRTAEDTGDQFSDGVVEAYQLIYFEGLTLDAFPDNVLEQKDLELYVVDRKNKLANAYNRPEANGRSENQRAKDSFKLYVYRGENISQDPGENGGSKNAEP